MMPRQRKLLFIVNGDRFFSTHRMELAISAIADGFNVAVATSNSGYAQRIKEAGIEFHEIEFDRYGTNPIRELRCIRDLYKITKAFKPDIIHNLTIKPVIYGSIVAKLILRNKILIINAITGLGYAFSSKSNNTIKKSILIILYRIVFWSKRIKVIFQNPDDQSFFLRMKIIPDRKAFLIKGSGVDLNRFNYHSPVRKSGINILFSGRLLEDKGLMDFIAAAKILNDNYPDIHFIVAGDVDNESKASIKTDYLKKAVSDGYINWIGYQENMISVLADSDIVALPSYYGEGIPKALIEACAIGRPILTTFTPGCKETLIDSKNGYFVRIMDPADLASKILMLSENAEKREIMGKVSRDLAVKEFDIESVIEKTLNLYRS